MQAEPLHNIAERNPSFVHTGGVNDILKLKSSIVGIMNRMNKEWKAELLYTKPD